MAITLRPQIPEDLPLMTGRDSEFMDYGPAAPPTEPRPHGMDDNGALTIAGWLLNRAMGVPPPRWAAPR